MLHNKDATMTDHMSSCHCVSSRVIMLCACVCVCGTSGRVYVCMYVLPACMFTHLASFLVINFIPSLLFIANKRGMTAVTVFSATFIPTYTQHTRTHAHTHAHRTIAIVITEITTANTAHYTLHHPPNTTHYTYTTYYILHTTLHTHQTLQTTPLHNAHHTPHYTPPPHTHTRHITLHTFSFTLCCS